MDKRTKLILGIVLGAIILFSGALFCLAKYGVIHIKYLADPLYGRVEITLDPSNTGGGINLYQNGNSVSAAGSFSSNVYTIPSLAYGSYTYKFGMPGPNGQPCIGPIANLSHYSSSTAITYTKFTCDGNGGGETQLYWILNGTVKSAGVAVSGATVSVGGKTATTSTTGTYTISQIPIPMINGINDVNSLKNQTISVSKTGYTSLSPKVSDIFPGISSSTQFSTTSPHNYNPSLTANGGGGDNPPVFDQTKFSLLGTITDKNGNLIDGVTVTVSCINSDQVPGVACGSTTSWSGTSADDYQTYYSGLPANKKFNYEVEDIDKFKDYTSFPRLRVTYSKTGYFWDQDGDGKDNDSTSIVFLTKPNTSYLVAPNIQKNLQFKDAKMLQRQYFTITGKIYRTLGGIAPAGNVKVALSVVEEPALIYTTTSKNNLYWPSGFPQGSQIGNYAFDNIPWNSDYTYEVKFESMDPSLKYLDTVFEINGDEVSFNSTYNRLLVILELRTMSPTNLTELIHFKDAITGADIDMSKETILDNTLTCIDADNENCVEGEPTIVGSTIKYEIDPNSLFATLQLKIETENYQSLSDEMYVTVGESIQYLLPKSSIVLPDNLKPAERIAMMDQQLFSCQIIETVKFCTFKANGSGLFTATKIAQMSKYAKIIKAMSGLAGINLPPYVFFWPAGYESLQRGFTMGFPNMPIFLSESALLKDIGYTSVSVLIHEFGHYIYFNSAKFDDDSEQKISIAYAIMHDDAGACIQSLAPKYTCFSKYADSEPGEFFAEFYQWWIQNLDEMDRLINDASLDQPDLTHCKNAMMAMDQMLQEYFPRMKRFKRVANLSLSNNGGEIAGTDTSEDENVTYFVNLMSSFGLAVGENHLYNKISTIDSIPSTKDQIFRGLWLKDNYNKLSSADKLRMSLAIQVQKASDTIQRYGSLTVESIRATLATINSSAEKLLISLGFNITNTRIYGHVKDQDGPVTGLMVNLGGKSDITDSSGYYNITRTKFGTIPIQITDPKIHRAYNGTVPSSLTISQNQSKNVEIGFTRQKYLLSGIILVANTPLSNGTVTVSGGQTYTLDAKGKFSFKLKEGQYKLIVKNKNGRTMTTTNAALFGNLNTVAVTKNITSLIWVK